MKKAVLRLLHNLNADTLRILNGLEQEGELSRGFVKEVAWDLARERFGLATEMLSSIVTPASPSEAAVRTAVSRAYYACHHACRAALRVKFFLDFRGHYAVIEQMEKWSLKDPAWKPIHSTIKDMIDRRHGADYDPDDPGSGGLLPILPVPTQSQVIAELQKRSVAVVNAVEAYLKSVGVL